MKATGIVRRIDELGRIVVPKEIRRVLKIREGDPIEIYTESDKEIVLKKYSPIGELKEFAKEYAESIARIGGYKAVITDRDQVISVSGGINREYEGKNLSKDIELIMEDREAFVQGGSKGNIEIIKNDEYGNWGKIVQPITCDGDVIGSVVIMGKEKNTVIGEAEQKMAGVAAIFLGKQMESSK